MSKITPVGSAVCLLASQLPFDLAVISVVSNHINVENCHSETEVIFIENSFKLIVE